MNPLKPLFSEEVQFAGWRNSHTSGPLVTFRLADSEALAVFEGMTVAKAGMAGQRLAMVLVEIGDDEKPVEPVEYPLIAAHRTVGPLCLLAVQLCRTVEFKLWFHIYKNPVGIDGDRYSEEQCREAILDICEIGSRRELDVVPAAADRFHNLIRRPYMEWLTAYMRNKPDAAAG